MDDEDTRKKLKELKDWYDYYMNRFFKRKGDKYRIKVRENFDNIVHVLKHGARVPVAEFIQVNPNFKPREKTWLEKEEENMPSDFVDTGALLKIKPRDFDPISRAVFEPSDLVDTGDLLNPKLNSHSQEMMQKNVPLSRTIYNPDDEKNRLIKQRDKDRMLNEAVKKLSTDTTYADSVTKAVARDLKNKDFFKGIPIMESKHLKSDEMVLMPHDLDPTKAVMIKGLSKEQQEIKDTVEKEEGEDVWKGLFKKRTEDEL